MDYSPAGGISVPIPGNYPKDLCDIVQTSSTEQLADQLKIKPIVPSQVILCINLRNLGELLDSQELGKISGFLTGFFDEVSEAIENIGGSYVNKMLGDGVLARFGSDVDGETIYNTIQNIRKAFVLHKRRFLQGLQQNILGMTCLLTKEDCSLGAIGSRKYRDFTLMSSDLFRAFRILEWVEADAVIISEHFKPQLGMDFISVRVFPSPTHPLFYSVVRRMTDEEKAVGDPQKCKQDCDWYGTCSWAHERGTLGAGSLLDCHDCHVHFVEAGRQPVDVCWHWDLCTDKYERKQNFDLSFCCSACERHRNCFHSYCFGRQGQAMVRCERKIPDLQS